MGKLYLELPKWTPARSSKHNLITLFICKKEMYLPKTFGSEYWYLPGALGWKRGWLKDGII